MKSKFCFLILLAVALPILSDPILFPVKVNASTYISKVSPNGRYIFLHFEEKIGGGTKSGLRVVDIENGDEFTIFSVPHTHPFLDSAEFYSSVGWLPWPKNGEAPIFILYIKAIYLIVGTGNRTEIGLYKLDISSILNGEPTSTVSPTLLSKKFSSSNYPNPFNPTTTIQYTIPTENKVSINIYDPLGRLIRNLHKNLQAAGTHSTQWDGTDNNGYPLASGQYLYEIISGEQVGVKKMFLLR